MSLLWSWGIHSKQHIEKTRHSIIENIFFHSNKFAPYLPEECQVNPNVLGFELANWLSFELAKIGVITSYPIAEDWGWFIEYNIEGREYLICCNGLENGKHGYEWRIGLERQKIFFRRPLVNESDEKFLTLKITKCLEKAGIVIEIM